MIVIMHLAKDHRPPHRPICRAFLTSNKMLSHKVTTVIERATCEKCLALLDVFKPKSSAGFSFVEVMIAMGLMLIVALGMVTMINNQNKALTHFRLRNEMMNLMVTATVAGNACKSVRVSGGSPPLTTCGAAGTPATIQILYADSTRVDANSGYLLQGVCNAGFYTLQIKSALATKVDPFNNQPLGVDFFAPAVLRFASQAFLIGGCP